MEKHLVQHCSPTLAGIKTAGLFGYSFASEAALMSALASANEILIPKGICAQILRVQENNALIYVYRRSMLRKDLEKLDIRMFLKGNGYDGKRVEDHIEGVKLRLANGQAFPHEIGVFLGYPLHDVIGFMENNGQNSKHTGCWKVYYDEHEAARLFAKFQKCKEIYTRLFWQGKSIERLIVAA